MRIRYIAFVVVFVAFFSAPLITRADILSDLQAQINNLLVQVDALQQQLRRLSGVPYTTVPTGNTAVPTGAVRVSNPIVVCPAIYRTLSRGSRGGDVSALQEFLKQEGVYTYPEITGYYGSVTEQAVQEWQRRNYVVQGGSPAINGFGVVGEKTRAAIRTKCANTHVSPVIPVEPSTPPVQCKVWYDGCNTCTRSVPGSVFACTKRACVWAETPRCEAYFSGAPLATPLTIHSFSGPVLLEVNEVGTWKIRASDPANGKLSYQIDWGERSQLGVLGAITPLLQEPFVQTTTFTHAYTIPGTYVVTITVRNNATGIEARTTTTVQVVAKKPSKNIISATPLTGAAPLTTTFYANVGGYSPYRYELDFGDGSARAEMNCYAPSDYCQAPASVTHVYTRNGSYTARLYQKHVAMSEETLLDSMVIVVGESAGVGQCRSNGVVHAIGTTRQCITEDTLGQQCLSNGYYVCRPEGWVVEGQTSTFCTLQYAPVCGQLNGKRKTYGNVCQLTVAGAVKVADGACDAAYDTQI